MSDPARVEIKDSVMEITIDRPKANAINAATSRRLGEVFTQFRDDPSLRVAIITGAGEKFFSAGWDLKAAARGEETDEDHGPNGFGGLVEMLDLDKPVIAAINGYCVAGGLEIALGADIMVAAENASFFLAEVNVGLCASPISLKRLTSRMPRGLALDMIYSGRAIDARQAEAAGFVNQVVPAGQAMDAAREVAARIAGAAPLAVRACKEIVRKCDDLSHQEIASFQKAGGLHWYDQVYDSEDAKEGPLAFTEGRDPVWKGR